MQAIGRVTLQPAAALLLALLMTAGVPGIDAQAGNARVYTWVDEQGVTHFSATPPESGKPAEAITIRTGEGVSFSLEAPATTSAAPPESPTTGANQAGTTRQRDPALCEQARETAAALADNDRVQVREDGGDDYRVLDADELEEWRERARADVRHHCR